MDFEDEDTLDARSILLASDAPNSIRRVSISQLHKAHLPHEKSLFQIDGRSVKKVMVVGNIVNKKETDTQIAYTIEDGSAQILARFWRDPSNSSAQYDLEYTDELRYVRVVGELNEFKMGNGNKNRSLILYPGSLEYIRDVYEIFFHTLHIITDTQSARWGLPAIAASESNIQHQSEVGPDATESEELESSLQNHTYKVPETPAKVRTARHIPPPSPTPRPRRTAPDGNNAEAGPSKLPKLLPLFLATDVPGKNPALEETILLVINEGIHALRLSRPLSAYEGLSLDDITEQVLKRKHVSSSQITEAILRLKDQGEIYETIDEHHFDLTDD